MIKLIPIFALLISFSFAEPATKNSADAAYYQDFKSFLEVSGANESQKVMLQTMFTQFKMMNPNNAIFNDMENLMMSELENLNKKLFPIYQKHLSHEDLKALIKLYNAPILQKMVKVQPQIIQDSSMIGMQWGQELSKRLLAK